MRPANVVAGCLDAAPPAAPLPQRRRGVAAPPLPVAESGCQCTAAATAHAKDANGGGGNDWAATMFERARVGLKMRRLGLAEAGAVALPHPDEQRAVWGEQRPLWLAHSTVQEHDPVTAESCASARGAALAARLFGDLQLHHRQTLQQQVRWSSLPPLPRLEYTGRLPEKERCLATQQVLAPTPHSPERGSRCPEGRAALETELSPRLTTHRASVQADWELELGAAVQQPVALAVEATARDVAAVASAEAAAAATAAADVNSVVEDVGEAYSDGSPSLLACDENDALTRPQFASAALDDEFRLWSGRLDAQMRLFSDGLDGVLLRLQRLESEVEDLGMVLGTRRISSNAAAGLGQEREEETAAACGPHWPGVNCSGTESNGASVSDLLVEKAWQQLGPRIDRAMEHHVAALRSMAESVAEGQLERAKERCDAVLASFEEQLAASARRASGEAPVCSQDDRLDKQRRRLEGLNKLRDLRQDLREYQQALIASSATTSSADATPIDAAGGLSDLSSTKATPTSSADAIWKRLPSGLSPESDLKYSGRSTDHASPSPATLYTAGNAERHRGFPPDAAAAAAGAAAEGGGSSVENGAASAVLIPRVAALVSALTSVLDDDNIHSLRAGRRRRSASPRGRPTLPAAHH